VIDSIRTIKQHINDVVEIKRRLICKHCFKTFSENNGRWELMQSNNRNIGIIRKTNMNKYFIELDNPNLLSQSKEERTNLYNSTEKEYYIQLWIHDGKKISESIEFPSFLKDGRFYIPFNRYEVIDWIDKKRLTDHYVFIKIIPI